MRDSEGTAKLGRPRFDLNLSPGSAWRQKQSVARRIGWNFCRQLLIFTLSFALLIVSSPLNLFSEDQPQPPGQDQPADQDQGPPPAAGQEAPYSQQTPEQLQRLVAPIALYPDSLVAQILAASTFPDEVVEADRWVQAHPDLKGEALGKAVNDQPWDPSVKALTAFPTVLGNMDKNLSWTSSLGDAYYNQQQDVMDAIQVMRHKAEAAGNLKSTPQQRVTNDGDDVEIEPADPEVVYVPAYNPWLVYGYPIVAWPGWYPYPGLWFGGPYLSFGVGFGIGWFGGFGWGWGHWGFDWHRHYVLFNHGRYFSHSRTFYNRANFYRGGVRGGYRPGFAPRPFNGDRRAARGFAAPRGQTGIHTGAFSHIERGGQARAFSSRGRASFGGGARGGGAHGGGGRRR